MPPTNFLDPNHRLPIRRQASLAHVWRPAFRWLPVFVAVLFSAPGIMGLGGAAAYAAGQQESFSAAYAGTAAFGSNGAPVFNGTGLATLLGRSATTGYVIFTSAPADCAGGVPNDNYETLTAANGDSFTIVAHDVACPIGPGQYHGSGNWTVVPGSGTGRFTGVSGQGTLDGQSDFVQGTFNFRLVGTLVEPQ